MMLVHVFFDSYRHSENLFWTDDSKLESIQKKQGQMDSVEPEIPTLRHFGPRWVCLYRGN